MSQVLCCRRCPFGPLTWRTTLWTRLLGCKAREAPALPYLAFRLRGWGFVLRGPNFVHVSLLAIVGRSMIIGCLGFDSSVSP
jgi:hypothetical protein